MSRFLKWICLGFLALSPALLSIPTQAGAADDMVASKKPLSDDEIKVKELQKAQLKQKAAKRAALKKKLNELREDRALKSKAITKETATK